MNKIHRKWLELLLQPHRNLAEMDFRFVDGLLINKPDKLDKEQHLKLLKLYDQYVKPFGTEL